MIDADAKFAKVKWAEKLVVSTSGYYTWLHNRKRRQSKIPCGQKSSLHPKKGGAFTVWIESVISSGAMGLRRPNGTNIPEHLIEALAQCLLPDILKFYESEEGQREFTEWKARQKIEQVLNSTGVKQN